MDGRWRQPLILLLGVGAMVLASSVGHVDVMGAILEPPPIGRLMLGIAALMLGIVLVLRAVDRVGSASADPRLLIRAVRLVFLALAAFAAAAGWFLGSGLPIVVALVIAGIDVIETTVLLLVVQATPDDEGPGPQ